MNKLSANLHNFISSESRKYNLSFFTSASLLFFPFLIIILAFFALWFPPTREFTILMCRENYPVDSLSFGFSFFAFVFGVILVLKMKKFGMNNITLFILSIVSFSFFIIAMEEIAWGQQLLNFRTPEYFKTINIEDNIKLQNVGGFPNNIQYLRLALGLIGLFGILLAKAEPVKAVAVPKILFGIFFTISIVAFIDLFNLGYGLNSYFNWISQIIELMIALAAFMYVWLLNRRIKYKPAFA